MIGPSCPRCRRIHSSDAVVTLGRFRPEGPSGYRASHSPSVPIRSTREEAMEDVHAHFEQGESSCDASMKG